MTRRLAVHAVTRGGAALGARVAGALGGELLVAEPVASAAPGARTFPLPMRSAVARAFAEYDGHVFVLAVGATVRLVAPLVASKWTDPAVVCLDEAGRFAVALLSGHAGGANALATEVAHAVGAAPVVTTASDARGTLRVDLLGRELGWTLEDPRGNATRAAAALVNGAPVLVVDEAGGGAWWPAGAPLPANIAVAPSLDGADAARWAAIVAITDRVIRDEAVLARAVLWRPRTLSVGVGCDRGASADAVWRAVRDVLEAHGLAPASIGAVGTIDLKRDEAGIVALAARLGCPLRLFDAAALEAAVGIERPSEVVRRHVGTRAVAEPAALLAARAARLLVPKQVRRDADEGQSVTVAVARAAREET
ncbi:MULTISPECIES: cobalt-precorrin 5A hydrolase [Anaeromyxobacter]|uniref:cobalt-precorrin 5A hydrolase n=1 Tax=Anaeromyxobacter TaxID=161492 RepID=UPI001F5746F6|nr:MULTISPECIES: cobalamin biosynthesis protein [unclassified Anaeromyxobacter]